MAEDLSRREFVLASAAVVAGLSLFGAMPSLRAEATLSTAGPVDAGPLSQYAADGLIDRFAGTYRFLLVRSQGKLYALSAVCTHKGRTVRSREGQIVCPAHGSRFGLDGNVSKGPARRALARHAISLKDGHVIVDTSRSFAPDQWNDAEAYLKVAGTNA